jgi:hypothetical protein
LAAADRGRWIVFEPFRPEEKPFEALESALARAHQNLEQPVPTEPVRTAAALGQQLCRLRLAAGQQDARVVIAIDQFEELLAREEGGGDGVGEEADAFLTLLAELLGQKNSQVLILATLRSDFYGLLQLHPSALHRRAGDPIPLGPMDVDGFRQVIEGPAQRVGVRLERGLSDRLVRGSPSGDALPLLAFTLRELWDGRADGAGLTLKQYDDFGGLAGAVQRKADEVLVTSGATEEEAGRDVYPQFRQKCEGVNVEVQRTVNLKAFALVRHPLTQAQWRTVAALRRLERDISSTPGTYEARGLWECYAQPGGLAVDTVSCGTTARSGWAV